MQAAQENEVNTNWFRVILDLERAGYTLASTAAYVGVGKSTVIGWKNQGVEPRHCDGERVLSLWCQLTGKGRDSVPTIGRYDWRR